MKALAIVLVLASGGCALFEDRPDHACKKPDDCLVAQGETCDLSTKTCVQGGGVDAPVATPATATPEGEAP